MKLTPTFEPPTTDEINLRKNKLIGKMKEHDIDCIVIADPHNVYWLTNFANYVHERPFILIMDNNGKLIFVVPKLEVKHVISRLVGDITFIEYEEFPCPEESSWSTGFKKQVDTYTKIALEENAPQFISEAIKQYYVVKNLVEEARYVKTDYEVRRIMYSSKVAAKAMEKLLKIAKPGMSAIASNKKISQLIMLQLFADNPETNVLATSTGVIVQSPNVSDDPHNFTNVMNMDMAVGGPHVSIINGVFNGYGTEVERTFFLGEVPSNAIRPYHVMMEARQLCFELCKPGADMHDVDYAVQSLFKKAGYDSSNIMHRVGHSIGVTGHEGPFLATSYHHEIKQNMLFTVEPGIYIEGVGGFRHSDTVLITQSGNQILTPVKDSLEDMTLSVSLFNLPLSPTTKQKLISNINRFVGLNV